MRKTPLEEWIRTKIGGKDRPLTRQALEKYQLRKLKETVIYARKNSPFYRKLLQDISGKDLPDISEIRHLPFTTADDLKQNPMSFLCVHPDRIARIVTLPTSGTTGNPKRIFFTGSDQELTIDFFHHGMATMVTPGGKVLILMPGELPGSIGDLLGKGLARMHVEGILHGPVRDVGEALEKAAGRNVQCLVGIPVQVYAMAQYQRIKGIHFAPHSILLSTDRTPPVIKRFLEQTWHCRVFDHYGMTETGLGGGVECEALAGYHLREADLLFEIVNPETGKGLDEGESGEVVFTTLTRKGMPLIRYRTGDISRFIPDPCPCGTILKRMDTIHERIPGRIVLKTGNVLTIRDLDEALFSLDGILDFTASVSCEGNKDCLHVTCRMTDTPADYSVPRIIEALEAIPAIQKAVNIYTTIVHYEQPWPYSAGTAKRIIDDRRTQPEQ